MADDDGDGTVDEDWLNGRDDDGDGLVDEDYAAISDQMLAVGIPTTSPRRLRSIPTTTRWTSASAETYQWSDDRYDDFVAVDFSITNIGTSELEDVYIAMFADFDAGPRGTEQLWDDDRVGYIEAPATCGDPLRTASRSHTCTTKTAMRGVRPAISGGSSSISIPIPRDRQRRGGEDLRLAHFAGADPYEQGGDPTNDFERYELLSRRSSSETPLSAGLPTLMIVGPFESLDPMSR